MLNHETGVAMYKSVFLLILFVLVGLSVLVSNRDATVNAQGEPRERMFTQLLFGEILSGELLSGVRISPYNITAIEGLLYFSAWHPVTGDEPWVSDGTPEGTTLLKDINPGAGNAGIGPPQTFKSFVLFEDWVYFFADDGVNGKELWRTDGTEEGTELFMEFIPGPEVVRNGGTTVNTRGIAHGRGTSKKLYIYFTGLTGDRELWVYE